jgi:hypothetical protein
MRKHMIGVRCSDEEFEAIGKNAAECGLRRATFLRNLGLGAVPRQRRNPAVGELIHQLTRVGNNLNQLARRHNSNEPVARGECLALLDQLRALFRRFE